MITRVIPGNSFINISAIISDRKGKSVQPALVEITVYRVLQTTGDLTVATEVGINGVLTLIQHPNDSELYSIAIDTIALGIGEYTVKFYTEVGNLESSGIDHFSISSSEQPGIIIHK